MAPSSKRRVSMKVNNKELAKITSAVSTIEAYLVKPSDVWPELTTDQKRLMLENSPLLFRIVSATEPFRRL